MFYKLTTISIITFSLFLFTIQTISSASITSMKSGNWSDPTAWNTGSVPTTGDSITIAPGHTVIYDVFKNDVLGEIKINGTLKFSRTTNTRLKTSDNIFVMMGGFLDMGTPQDQIPKTAKAEIIFVLPAGKTFLGNDSTTGMPIDMANDTGLWVMDGGRWETHGAPLVRTWSKLAETASAEGNTVTLQNDVTDWPIGGNVVITMTNAPTDRGTGPWQNEVRTIAALEKLSDGKTKITLDKTLAFTHDATPRFQGEVGLLTRNVRIETELAGVTETQILTDMGTRRFAHTMYMHGSRGNVQFTELKYMGHYLALGRYPIHAHMMDSTSSGMVIRGNGIWYTGFRWITIHSSDNILVEDNVGFSSMGTGYYNECNPATNSTCDGEDANHDMLNEDIAFIHNLGVEVTSARFADRGFGAGIYRRMGTFWPNSKGEAHFGNVAVGLRGGADTGSGYPFGENHGPVAGGTIGAVLLVKNEVHSMGTNGFWSWSNRKDAVDIVDLLNWRNGGNGYDLGAYVGDFKMYNNKIYENRGLGIGSTVVRTFFQDSVISGTGSETGRRINGYFKTLTPDRPHWDVRNTYENLSIGYTHNHEDSCPDLTVQKQPTPDSETSKGCIADYTYLMSPTFINVAKPFDFGWQPNANSWNKVANAQGIDPALPVNFYLNRPDQLDPAKQGPLSAAIIGDGSNTTIYAPYDALLTPISSPWADYPPTVSLDVSMNGKLATVTAIAADDKNTPTIEIYADWVKVKECTATSCIATYDFSTYPRKYAYIWARAFDGTAVFTTRACCDSRGRNFDAPYKQRAYSNVIELGPEVLLQGQPVPTPTPTPTPTPSPLPTASSFDKLYIFLDKVEKITLTGSNLTGTFNVTFLQTGVPKLTFTSITGGGDKLELDFTTNPPAGGLSSLPLGEYTVQVTRISDSLTLTHPKTFVFTRLGDLWKQGATETTEQKRDGKVDINDVSRLLSKWNSTNPQDLLEADVNAGPNNVSQGKIDIYDANRLMSNWTP